METKPKRGVTQFYYNGVLVYFWKIVSYNSYHVCFDAKCTDAGEVVEIECLLPVNKGRQLIKSNSNPKPTTDKKELKDFFVSLKIPMRCENCNFPLFATNDFARRCVSAHILPKSLFPSIATNADNIIFLGSSLFSRCNCHNRFDEIGAKERSQMNIYDKVVSRYETLKESLTEAEIVKANKYLNIT